jgi:hypothetical protein
VLNQQTFRPYQARTGIAICGNPSGKDRKGRAPAATAADPAKLGHGIPKQATTFRSGRTTHRNDAGTDIAALPAFGAYAAYTHVWPKRFRSTGVFGYTRVSPSDPQPATAFFDSYYGLANLLWNPEGSLDLGVEYLHGTHDIKDGEGAQVSRLQFSAKDDFFRKRPVKP